MHNPTSFAEHCLSLLKNSGPSGPTGPAIAKPFKSNDKAGTTELKVLGPVDIDWSHDGATSGPAKNTTDQRLDCPAPTGTSGTTNFERGRAKQSSHQTADQSHSRHAELNAPSEHLPALWIEGVDHLRTMDIPDCFSTERWRYIVDDADAFLKQWGVAAANLGWSAHDLFGVHPAAPAVRFDAMGLIPLLHGNPVIALTETTATLRGSSGSIQRFNRIHKVRGICLWEIGQ